jgi:hypothetical protein
MKTISKAATYKAATDITDGLLARGIIGYVYAPHSRYEVRVLDSDEAIARAALETANGTHAAQEPAPEVTA